MCRVIGTSRKRGSRNPKKLCGDKEDSSETSQIELKTFRKSSETELIFSKKMKLFDFFPSGPKSEIFVMPKVQKLKFQTCGEHLYFGIFGFSFFLDLRFYENFVRWSEILKTKVEKMRTDIRKFPKFPVRFWNFCIFSGSRRPEKIKLHRDGYFFEGNRLGVVRGGTEHGNSTKISPTCWHRRQDAAVGWHTMSIAGVLG